MLRSLHIENIAVVKRADIDFCGGFTVLTGETGAGKSVIIDGINMLLGAKVSGDIIRNGESFALSEAIFDSLTEDIIEKISDLGIECDDGEIVLTCKLGTDGRTSVRVNGRAVTKSVLREMSRYLISIHGQHDSHILFDKNSYVHLIDSYGRLESDREKYSSVYKELEGYRKKLRDLNSDEAQKEREKDMLEYQIKDIDSKKLREGEEEELEAERLRLGSIEKINKHVNFAYRVLQGGEKGASASYMLSRASESLKKISDVVPDALPLAEKLLDMSYDISDIAEQVKVFACGDGEDPNKKIDRIESRLEVISTLKRKYGRDIKAILEFRNRAVARLDEIAETDERASEYEDKITELENEAADLALDLSKKRKAAGLEASEKIMEVLLYLDMPSVRFNIEVNASADLNPSGCDKIELMVATNPGEPMQPMREIASGGEMARIMLAIRSVLNEKDGVGCAVYDEIDTGISGKTSRKIGIKLHDIAKETQVICVTHSAQIATLADNHLLISKKEIEGRAQTEIRLLDREERVEEAARILGGINITEAQRQAARDMLDNR